MCRKLNPWETPALRPPEEMAPSFAQRHLSSLLSSTPSSVTKENDVVVGPKTFGTSVNPPPLHSLKEEVGTTDASIVLEESVPPEDKVIPPKQSPELERASENGSQEREQEVDVGTESKDQILPHLGGN